MRGDLKSFGSALKRAREVKGLTQQDVIEQIPQTYSDDRALRRVENGERRPKRQAIVELMIKALRETSAEKIDLLLELAGYEVLSDAEVEQHKLLKSKAFPGLREIGEPDLESAAPIERPTVVEATSYIGCVAVVVMVGVLVLQTFHVSPIWLSAITSALYACLYSTSILLEASYEGWYRRTYCAGAFAFAFIFVTSVIALAVDAWGINKGNEGGLWGALFIVVLAAAGQWFAVRWVLPGASIVPSRFQTLTAQAAHLKNTLYFLLLGFAFWLVPFHAGFALRRIALSGGVPQNGGTFTPKPIWLWGLLVVVMGVSVPMGAHLLENLKPGPNLNRYLGLFYGRAILCFVLCIVCLVWYSIAAGRAPDELLR